MVIQPRPELRHYCADFGLWLYKLLDDMPDRSPWRLSDRDRHVHRQAQPDDYVRYSGNQDLRRCGLHRERHSHFQFDGYFHRRRSMHSNWNDRADHGSRELHYHSSAGRERQLQRGTERGPDIYDQQEDGDGDGDRER